MSTIGRIFIVLNLVLAAAFLGWASNAVATNQQWKAKHDEVLTQKNEEVGALESTLSGVRQEVSQKTRESADRADERNAEKARADAAEASLKRELERNGRLEEQLAALDGKVGTIEKTLQQVESDRNAAVQASIDAKSQADDALAAQRAAENAQRSAEEQHALAERTIADLERSGTAKDGRISQLETELATVYDATGTNRSDYEVQEFIEGNVLAYNSDLGGLVTLNVGSKDGVKRGYTFEIFAGATYKGRVRVMDVVDDMCSALVDMPVDGRLIAVGDKAATRL